MPNFEAASPSLLSRHRMSLAAEAWPRQPGCPAAQRPSRAYFLWTLLCFILIFMICIKYLWHSLTSALIMGRKELLLHTKATVGVCSQHCIHSGSCILVNSPRIPAAGACHQAGTPPVINPVTHQPAIPRLPNTGLAKALELALLPFP